MKIRKIEFNKKEGKRLIGLLLTIAMVLTGMYGLVSFILHITAGGGYMTFISSSAFITTLVLFILEWVGYTILHGKFQVPAEFQQRGQRPVGRQPQPIKARQQIPPVIIKMDKCSYCEKEKPITELTEFKDDKGNIILVCEKCINGR